MTLTKSCCAVPIISHICYWLRLIIWDNKWSFLHIHCNFTYLVEIGTGVFDQKLMSSCDYRPYCSVMRPDLYKVINGIFHISHTPFRRFCWNSAWETCTNMHSCFHISLSAYCVVECTLSSFAVCICLYRLWNKELQQMKPQHGGPSLLRVLVRCFGGSVLWLGLAMAVSEFMFQ
jgi:hypothetical protein